MLKMNCIKYNDFELKQYTTLKIGGKAKLAYIPASEDEFINAIIASNFDYEIIGIGSNLLIASDGIYKPCILTKEFKDIKMLDNNRIYASCGVKSSVFAKFACEHNLKDAEFLIGIPGSIGGAVFMNAGAHEQNVKDIIESVKILNKNGETMELSGNELSFNYRTSIFADNNYTIISAIFKMSNGNPKDIKEKMNFHVNYRAGHHPPLTEYSAGSTFRNPENNYAANLLEQVGAKEYIENNKIRFSVKHANFLYNFNNANSTDTVRLMYKMWNKVKDIYNIELKPEIKFIGNKTNEENELWKIMTKQ